MSYPILIKDSNLSDTWCNTLSHITGNKLSEITPLVVSISDFSESGNVRSKLNSHLKEENLKLRAINKQERFASIETVSETIFPNSLYSLLSRNREKLYKTYLENVLPRIKKIDNANARGTYFERLIAYDDPEKDEKVNQLEIIIKSLLEKSDRRSKLQASIFNPTKDHLKTPYQKFPCLQHVTCNKSESGGLVLNSFYANQYLYQRAYGNWLGLINLGKFIANETNLKFERFNCFVGIEKLDHLTRKQAESLLKELQP